LNASARRNRTTIGKYAQNRRLAMRRPDGDPFKTSTERYCTTMTQRLGHGIRAKRSKSGAVSFDLVDMEVSHASVQ